MKTMNLTEAVKRLGLGQQLGLQGTDWSWYYKWEVDDYHGVTLVTDKGKPARLTYEQYVATDWIIKGEE